MIVLNWFAVAAICAYRFTLGRYLAWRGLRCRHFPTCSHYGILAFQKHDFFKATKLTWKRYCDCHPASDRAFIDFP